MKKKAPSFSLTRRWNLSEPWANALVGLALLASAFFAGPQGAAANPVGDVGSSVALALDVDGAGIALGNGKAVWWEASATGLQLSVGTKRFSWREKTFDPQVSFASRGRALGCTPGGVVRFLPKPVGAFERSSSPEGWDWQKAFACSSVSGTSVALLDVAPLTNTPRLRIARWPDVFAGGGDAFPSSIPEEVASFDLRAWGFENVSHARGARLVARTGEGGFWLVGANGRVFALSAAAGLAQTEPWVLNEIPESANTRPLPLESTTSLAAHGNLLLRAGDEGVFLFSVTGGNGGSQPKTLARTRLPINPCAENERCGVSVAADGSWFVCGSWGCSLGKGTVARRIALPALGEETGTLSLAHNGESGRFAFFGVRDADVGLLPGAFTWHGDGENENRDAEKAQLAREEQGASRGKVVGWTKPAFKTPSDALQYAARHLPKKDILFPYASNGFWGAVVIVQTSTREIETPHETLLPVLAAWEPARAFAPPPLDTNAWQPRGRKTLENATTWWRDALRLDEALAALTQEGRVLKRVKVGVVDSGIDVDHPSFQGLLSADGYDFVDEDDVPEDGFGHGTHVASLVSSRVPEGAPRSGLPLGVAPNAELIIARALDDAGRSDSIGLARALAHVVQKGARVVNCSWGGGPETQLLRDAFAFLKEEGIFVASSAGNDGLDTDKFPQVPKKFSGVLNTAASTPAGRRARFSSYGKESVFLYAPGEDILGALPGGELGGKSGTSMASPLTAGTAALLLGAGATLESTPSLLCEGARREGEFANTSRCGLLDTFGAARALLQNVVEPERR